MRRREGTGVVAGLKGQLRHRDEMGVEIWCAMMRDVSLDWARYCSREGRKKEGKRREKRERKKRKNKKKRKKIKQNKTEEKKKKNEVTAGWDVAAGVDN